MNVALVEVAASLSSIRRRADRCAQTQRPALISQLADVFVEEVTVHKLPPQRA
jgi:hypothetical protein